MRGMEGIVGKPAVPSPHGRCDPAAEINTSMRTYRITAAMMPRQRQREREAVLAAIFSALDAMRAGYAC